MIGCSEHNDRKSDAMATLVCVASSARELPIHSNHAQRKEGVSSSHIGPREHNSVGATTGIRGRVLAGR